MELQKTSSYAKAYVEILEIINHMGEEYKKKVPSKLLDFFEENKDSNYVYKLDEAKNNEEQMFSNETIGLLSMLELKYWAKDKERELLNNALIENEKKYQKILRERYNPDNIFANRNQLPKEQETAIENRNVDNKMSLVEINENIFTKFFKKLKNFFHIK